MLKWAEKRWKQDIKITPSWMAKQYASIVLKNGKQAPSLIRDMQKLKARMQGRQKRKTWAKMAGRKIKERIKGPRARVPARAAYWETIYDNRMNAVETAAEK